MKRKFAELTICPAATILHAMEQMDRVGHKLLLVQEGNQFIGLLSIGSIQRAIIRGESPKTPIVGILRKDIIVCTPKDSEEHIRREMLRCRSEYMPIVDESGQVVDIVFWEDLFGTTGEHARETERKYDLPVVVMAGGEGTRLRPLTNILPKPLLPIGEKTIIETIMDRFVMIGCHRFYVSLNYMADTIERYLTEHNDGRYDFTFYREDQPMGSGGSLSLIRDQIKESFFVTNCDNILHQDLAEIVEVHRQNKNEMTVVAAVKSLKLPYGNLVTGDYEQVVRVEEKPEFLFRVNTGVYVLEPHLLKDIPDNQYFPITDLMNIIIKRQERVGCFPVTDGSWCDIGNWDDYTRALGR